jgi:hypothetical protein
MTDVIAQLEALAARQYAGDEIGQLRFLVEQLKQKLLEYAYAKEAK